MNVPNFTGAVREIVWTPGVSLESLIQQVVEAAYNFYKGNKTATAQALGISIRTLDNKLEKYEKDQKAHARQIDERTQKRTEFLARQRAIPAGARYDNAASPTAFDPASYSGVPTGREAAPAVKTGNGPKTS